MTEMWYTQQNIVCSPILLRYKTSKDKKCEIIKTRCFETGIPPIQILYCFLSALVDRLPPNKSMQNLNFCNPYVKKVKEENETP